MPYPYGYFKPTGKEQGAMAIGSLLAGLLSAAQPRQPGEASPALKGIAGAVGGYGSGYKAYQDMMGDAFTRDLYDRKYNQDVNQFDQQMGLNREKFGEEKRQFEESEKPYREAMGEYYKQPRGNKEAAIPSSVAEWQFGQNIQNPRQRSEFLNRTMPLQKREKIKPPKMPDVGNYGKLQEQLAGLKASQNMDYIGMPADERAKRISAIENSIRLMEKYNPELIPPQQQTQQIPQQGDVMNRYQNDPDMQGTTIGKLTDKGYEVFRNGKPVGHYQ